MWLPVRYCFSLGLQLGAWVWLGWSHTTQDLLLETQYFDQILGTCYLVASTFVCSSETLIEKTYIQPLFDCASCVFIASMHETCRVHTTSFLCTYNSRPHVYYDSELEGIKQLPRRRTNLGQWFAKVKSVQNIVVQMRLSLFKIS